MQRRQNTLYHKGDKSVVFVVLIQEIGNNFLKIMNGLQSIT